MNDTRSFRIVVGIDFSDTGDLALTEALRLCGEKPHTELHAVHVVTDFELDDAPGDTRLERQNTVLETLPAQIWDAVRRVGETLDSPPDGIKVSVHVRFGRPVAAIEQVAIDYDADWIVVGTHGRRAVERFVLGSVASGLVQSARCPVLVVREKDFSGARKSDRPEPPSDEAGRTGNIRRPHVYVSTDTVSWTEHNSETTGPTGVRMI